MKRAIVGITLIEAMVVVAIVAILAAIAAHAYQNAINNARVKSAAEAVYSQIQLARSESIKQNRNIFVTVKGSGTADWCIGMSDDTGCDCSEANSCSYGPAGSRVEHNIAGSSFTDIIVATTKAELEFTSRSGATADGGNTITVTGSSGLNTEIRTSTLGRVRICGGNIKGYQSC